MMKAIYFMASLVLLCFCHYISEKKFMETPTTGNFIRKGVIYINEPGVCFICKKTDLESESKYCPDCGFPQGGEQQEQTLFYRNHITKQVEFSEAQNSVKGGQQTLFWTAGLCLLSGFLGAALDAAQSSGEESGADVIIGGFILAVIFVGLGVFGQKNPLIAIISGFVIYVSVLLLGLVMFIYSGGEGHMPIGVVSIIILIYLGKGISGVLKAERLRKEKGWDWRTNL